jgi:glycosyltransferase involved in cell wall biosynthesis
MKIFILLDDPQLPSSRVSALQFVELMRAAGWEVEVGALRAPELMARQRRAEHIAGRLRMRRAAKSLVDGMLARMEQRHEDDLVARAAAADVVYVVKAPRLDLLRRLAALPRPKLLFHVSDAYWLPFLRAHGWADADAMIALADGVTTTNEFTAAHVRAHAIKANVFVVPDCPQVEDFDRRRASIVRADAPIVVGWIGTPLTAPSLFRIWQPLERLAREQRGWTLRMVGTGAETLMVNVPRFEHVRWSALPWYGQEVMIDEVLAMHVGVFPLFEGDDALARGSLKALIYMSGGAASVSQRYGDNLDVITDGGNGLLADSDDEWFEKLRRLIVDPSLRASIAENGLRTVHRDYSREAVFRRLRAAIES